ncbi:hypothetical protein C8N46_103186 [Kordia periserrulae]|uniref:Uncharacterized protein n=1 Tax=Kordia periserrulae TaxID=701523 RepID=A0A2T6C194_9FLAO|nr:hypothetical protein [Kordia periserrulae]PTX62088.1 hypothetical protein C8N46_103186 [Kordia periserrulae]
MKTYKSIEETIADVRKKDKRYNYVILIVVILMIAVIASLIIYAQDKRNRANEELIAKYELELIENKRLRMQDSLQTDSITQLVKTLRKELATIERKLDKNEIPEADKMVVLNNVNLAQDKLNRITNNVMDHTIVRYYKRKADGNRIERLIQSMKDPKFNLNLKQVPNDDGRTSVNTVWYGADVEKGEVRELVNALLQIGVNIKNVKEFDNPSTKDWKSEAIEIGYEALPNTTKSVTKADLSRYVTKNTNSNYYVRLYSYNPNAVVKRNLTQYIKKQNYNLKVYPDWEKKPSFFSNSPTIFYYSDKSKAAAEELKNTLNKLNRRLNFTIKRGNGYGIEKRDLDNTFIVHYLQ